MHIIDLSKKEFRTDLISEEKTGNLANEDFVKKEYTIKKIKVEELEIKESGAKKLNRKPGLYRTIYFDDVTDKDHYQCVEEVFTETLKKFLSACGIGEDDSALIVGLGNKNSTPDALGPKVIEQVLVTRHLFLIGEVEKGYRNTSALSPNVTGTTGIETGQLIKSVIEEVKPDFLIIIDALKANNMDRITKTIQLSNTGIIPGSGVGNHREELSKESLKIPAIVIGVPTIVDLVTIVSDTIHYLYRHFSYQVDHQNSAKLKLIPQNKQDYKDYPDTLTTEEKTAILGSVGNLEEEDLKNLITEVLVPIHYNLMVTPKEIDFTIEKLSLLLGQGINKSLHEHFNPTKN